MEESKGSRKPVTTSDVQKYWEEHPLFSLEIRENYGSGDFYRALDEIKLKDTEVYSLPYWDFNGYEGKKVLDIGCGPGWYTVQYAKGGADVTGVDLTEQAVNLAGKFIEIEGLDNARVQQADAQNLPFDDNTFDLAASSGVLHHVPDPQQAFREVRRVLKPGGEAKLTLYYKNILLRNPLLFRLLLFMLRIFKVRHHDVNSGCDPKTPEDFVRMYDGKHNPLGIALTNKEWSNMFERAGLEVVAKELHFFPMRFIKKNRFLRPFRKFLDSRFGFLIYYRLKPLDK